MTHKLIYLARRAANVSREDWPQTWRSHAVFASQFPALEAKIDWMRYCNSVETTQPGISQHHDGVAIAAGEGLEALNGGGLSAADRARIDEDELRVFDMLTPNFTYYCDENLVHDGPLRGAAVFSFLARQPQLSHEEFDERWNGRNAEIANAAFSGIGGDIRYVHNRPLHEPRPLFPFDGIGEAWFPSADDALRIFMGRELDPMRLDLREIIDMSRSVIVLTTVCHAWPKD